LLFFFFFFFSFFFFNSFTTRKHLHSRPGHGAGEDSFS
jgi:hypothetical protein